MISDLWTFDISISFTNYLTTDESLAVYVSTLVVVELIIMSILLVLTSFGYFFNALISFVETYELPDPVSNCAWVITPSISTSTMGYIIPCSPSLLAVSPASGFGCSLVTSQIEVWCRLLQFLQALVLLQFDAR